MVWSQIRQKNPVLIEDDFTAIMEEFRHNGTESELFQGAATAGPCASRHSNCQQTVAECSDPAYVSVAELARASMPGADTTVTVPSITMETVDTLNNTLQSCSAPRRKQRRSSNDLCVFCKNNGETTSFFTSHMLKDQRGIIQCPVLRAYTCPTCGVNGDHAHTVKYCPLRRSVRGRRRVVIL